MTVDRGPWTVDRGPWTVTVTVTVTVGNFQLKKPQNAEEHGELDAEIRVIGPTR